MIIRWEVIQDPQAGILKIDQNSYICNLVKAKKISLCQPTIFLIKAGSAPFLNQVKDHIQADLTIY